MIRELRLEDYEETKELIYEILSLHLLNRPDIYMEGNPLPKDYFNYYLTNPDNTSYVYLLDNKIVGVIMAKITINSGIGVMKDRKICFIDDIVVSHSKRRLKIGTTLYNHLKEVAKKKDCLALELIVWSFNEDAIKFYESLGMNIKNIRFEEKIN